MVDTDFSRAEVVALVGAVVAVVAAFLPWVTAGVEVGPIDAGGTSAGIEGLGFVTAVLALVVVGLVFVLDWDDRGAGASALVGAVIALVAIVRLLDLGGPVSPGIGLYLTILCGAAVAAAGVAGYVREDSTADPIG